MHLRFFEFYERNLSSCKLFTGEEVNRVNTNHYQDFVNIGLNILYYRKKKGLTQAQLAELTFYSRNHIQQIETA